MRIVIVNKSDRRGGAAVVSSRLLDALRAEGADARMLVAEKLGDSPWVETIAPQWRMKIPFLTERLGIFMANGMDRGTLFKTDSGTAGMDLLAHPRVREADAVLLNWVNQGLLSLDGIRALGRAGKRLVWTMHDMWCMTGICHHTDGCGRYASGSGSPGCGECHFLGKRASHDDLSRRVWNRKRALYADVSVDFVAVSSWLAERGRQSGLLEGQRLHVIPNAFPLDCGDTRHLRPRPHESDPAAPIRLLFGAARLDDTVKGLPVLREATRILAQRNPGLAARCELVTFGSVRDPRELNGFGIRHSHLGTVRGDGALADLYATATAVVSTSLYETLPGTLVEGQAYGAIPVATDRGGQSDIIDHLETGWLAHMHNDLSLTAASIAEGMEWAAKAGNAGMRAAMARSVRERFAPAAVANAYLDLLRD